MGKRVSAGQDPEASQRSANIDRIIRKDSKRSKTECKVLLLGPRKSGKSTLLKQMKIIYGNGFSTEERIAYRAAIYQNLLEEVQAVILAMYKLSIEPVDVQNRETARRIANYEPDTSIDSDSRLPEHFALSISRLWRDPAITQIMDYHAGELDLTDGTSYFIAEVERIGSSDYIPNDSDILKCREKGVGVAEATFDFPPHSYPTRIRMISMTGHCFDWKKWIHHFDDVTSIILCVALSKYDQVQYGQNGVEESIEMFESIVNSRFFSRASIILYMNKIEVFRNKISRVPLERYFPDYTGGPDPDEALEYITQRFTKVNHANLRVYQHFMQATNPPDLRWIICAIKDTITTNQIAKFLKE